MMDIIPESGLGGQELWGILLVFIGQEVLTLDLKTNSSN